MNKPLLILLLFSINVTAQKLDRKTYYEYSENLEFRIFGINKQRVIDRGNGYYANNIVAEKGRRFITVIFEFKNNSSQSQEIDFNKIYLRDKNGELHKIDFVVMSMKMTSRTNKLQQKLNANKKRKIVAQFRPSFDKDEIIHELVIGEKIIKLNYN
ncbi:hypothetical protein [Mangrovimonas spongiae]|uniref:DUF4352 domain-containing protein n=1 Tax=Mangrovimonas spongiae TaxID=2494697 RepID=A0A3R9P0L9_9FLAO|nr:hypothetical protein [Mangrovimonas spongiae]RSK41664.1 hypothetical protein EJA19_01960 [Mangrovimonas spongiae]